MARVRPRRHCPLLCASAERIGNDQEDPERGHLRIHRLAFLSGDQARVEDVRAWPARFLLFALMAGPAHAHEEPHDQRLPTIGPAPDFTLTSQDGARVSLHDFRARWSPSLSSMLPALISARC
ncbi:hypothetical protein MES4922_130160 [Mesorhizobium ventifaucium]|uniref:Redoxin domain-containing protein n=1 Tax=Mesorhizobium ventifaucium TaxID=666020 RepID=A0ABN8JF94_9HYPH|nr:hypothetical protein MES4922_130160 [Mesorhizobium ventifaucium]